VASRRGIQIKEEGGHKHNRLRKPEEFRKWKRSPEEVTSKD